MLYLAFARHPAKYWLGIRLDVTKLTCISLSTQAFVHVSTAFNNLDKDELAEEIYPASLDPEKLMDFVDSMDDQLLASITKQYDLLCYPFHNFLNLISMVIFTLNILFLF